MWENGVEVEAVDGDLTTVDGETLSSSQQTTEAGDNSQRSLEILAGDKAAELVEDGDNSQLRETMAGGKEVAQAADGANRQQTAITAGASNQQTAIRDGTNLNNLNSRAGETTTKATKEGGAETAETDGDLDLSLIILSIDKLMNNIFKRKSRSLPHLRKKIYSKIGNDCQQEQWKTFLAN